MWLTYKPFWRWVLFVWFYHPFDDRQWSQINLFQLKAMFPWQSWNLSFNFNLVLMKNLLYVSSFFSSSWNQIKLFLALSLFPQIFRPHLTISKYIHCSFLFNRDELWCSNVFSNNYFPRCSWKYSCLRGDLYGAKPATNWKFIFSLISHRRFVYVAAGHDIC